MWGMLQLAMACETRLPTRKWGQPKFHDLRSSETYVAVLVPPVVADAFLMTEPPWAQPESRGVIARI